MRQFFFAGATVLLATCILSGFLNTSAAISAEVEVEVRPLKESDTPQVAWDAFTSALRQGDMHAAYALVSDDSKPDISYRDFCVRWHPLSARYQDVLQPPGFSEFCISGGVAMIRFGLGADKVRAGHTFRAALVEEEGHWKILDGPSVGRSLCEAAARSTIQRLATYSPLVRKALQQGGIVNFDSLRAENPRFFEESAVREVLRSYKITIDSLREGAVIATPRRAGLRAYACGLDGRVGVYDGTNRPHYTGEQLAKMRQQAAQEKLRKQKAQAARLLQEQQVAQQRALEKRRIERQRALEMETARRIAEGELKSTVITEFHADASANDPSIPQFSDPDRIALNEVPGAVVKDAMPQPAPIANAADFETLSDEMMLPELEDSSSRPVVARVKPAPTTNHRITRDVTQAPLPDFVPMAAPKKQSNGSLYPSGGNEVPVAEVDLGNGVFVVEEQEFDGTTDELLQLIDQAGGELNGTPNR